MLEGKQDSINDSGVLSLTAVPAKYACENLLDGIHALASGVGNLRKLVVLPSGQAQVCKTCHGSSILPATSKSTPAREEGSEREYWRRISYTGRKSDARNIRTNGSAFEKQRSCYLRTTTLNPSLVGVLVAEVH